MARTIWPVERQFREVNWRPFAPSVQRVFQRPVVPWPQELLNNPAHPWTAQRDFFPDTTWDQFVPLERALQEEDEVSYV